MASPGHVLIVEDDLDTREMLVTLLRGEGFMPWSRPRMDSKPFTCCARCGTAPQDALPGPARPQYAPVQWASNSGALNSTTRWWPGCPWL